MDIDIVDVYLSVWNVTSRLDITVLNKIK